jgi:hypothetical protein
MEKALVIISTITYQHFCADLSLGLSQLAHIILFWHRSVHARDRLTSCLLGLLPMPLALATLAAPRLAEA